MDTNQFDIYDHKLGASLLKRLDNIGSDSSYRDKDGRRFHLRNGFRQGISKKIDGKDFLVYYDRIFPSLPAVRCIVHLSQFISISEYKCWAERIFENDLDTALNAPISRLDCCVDISGIPHSTLAKAATVKGRRRSSSFGKMIAPDCIRFGNQPYQVAIYYRELAPIGADFPTDQCNDDHFCTRIEARFWKPKIPILNLTDANSLMNFNPFTDVSLLSPNPVIVKTPGARSRHHLNSFLYLCTTVGAHEAKRQLNENRNFQRDVAPYLGTLDLDLFKLWQHRISRFLDTDRPNRFNQTASQ